MNERSNSTSMLLLLCFFLIVGAADARTAPGSGIALTHVTLIDGTGAESRSDMTVILEGEWIADIFRSGTRPLPPGVEAIDFSGRYLIPGLINTHVHFDQIGLGRDPERIHRELRRMLYGGVTTAFSAAGDARLLGSLQRSLLLGEVLGPGLYYTALMAGPDFMTHDPRVANSSQGLPRGQAAWAQTVTRGSDPEVAVARALGTHASALKFYVGVDADVIRGMTEQAHRHGMKAWAHSTVFPDRPIEVVRAGVDVLSHVCWLAWQDDDLDPSTNVPYTHTDRRNPRPTFETALVEPSGPEMLALFEEMARRGTILDTTASILAVRPSGSPGWGCTKELAVALLREAHDAGVQLATGTDYFLPEEEQFPSVLREIEFLVGEGVLTPIQAITAGTLHGARAIGIDDTHGTIEPGKIADMVVLRNDPTRDIQALRSVEAVIKEGKRQARANYEAERRDTLSETARVVRAVRERLAAEQHAFATGDCDAAMQYYAEAEPLFVTAGRVIPTRRNLLLACGSIMDDRPGTREVQQEDVIVLGPSVAYSVTRYANSVEGQDGTITSLPSVVTNVWARQGDAWRIVHFHESSGSQRSDQCR